MNGAHDLDLDAHDHGAHDDHDLDFSEMFTQTFWDERYGAAESVWSGNPNPQLVTHASDLPPGTALDVGSGEGADAIWLAAGGWQVTAVDVSAVALARAAERAQRRELGDRIAWEQGDLIGWDPSPRQFDLVSAQFMYLPPAALTELHRRLAAAVRPGGKLLIVGHDMSDLQTSMGRPHLPESYYYSGEQIAASLTVADWEISFLGSPKREVRNSDGEPTTITDTVLFAQRVASV
jgi:SAM-dependent methyltransferase